MGKRLIQDSPMSQSMDRYMGLDKLKRAMTPSEKGPVRSERAIQSMQMQDAISISDAVPRKASGVTSEEAVATTYREPERYDPTEDRSGSNK